MPETSHPLDQSNPEIRVAARLLGLLQQRLGELAPTGVEVSSHNKDHVLFTFQYSAENFAAGKQALNNRWIMLAMELGCSGSSFMPNPDNHNAQSLMKGITLEKLDRMLAKKELGGNPPSLP